MKLGPDPTLTSNMFPYSLTPKSLVMDKRSETIAILDKLAADTYGKVKVLHGYAPLDKPGHIKSLQVTQAWAVEMKDPDTVMLLRNLSQLKTVTVAWVLEYETEESKLLPKGLAVVCANQVNLKAGETMPAV